MTCEILLPWTGLNGHCKKLIHVFRTLMTTSREEVTCTRSVTPANYDSHLIETLSQIIENWNDLEIEER